MHTYVARSIAKVADFARTIRNDVRIRDLPSISTHGGIRKLAEPRRIRYKVWCMREEQRSRLGGESLVGRQASLNWSEAGAETTTKSRSRHIRPKVSLPVKELRIACKAT